MNPQQRLTAKGSRKPKDWGGGGEWTNPKPVLPYGAARSTTSRFHYEGSRAEAKQEARLTARRQFR